MAATLFISHGLYHTTHPPLATYFYYTLFTMYIHSFPSQSFKRETVYTATIDPSVNNDQQPTKYVPTTKDKVIGCTTSFLYLCTLLLIN